MPRPTTSRQAILRMRGGCWRTPSRRQRRAKSAPRCEPASRACTHSGRSSPGGGSVPGSAGRGERQLRDAARSRVWARGRADANADRSSLSSAARPAAAARPRRRRSRCAVRTAGEAGSNRGTARAPGGSARRRAGGPARAARASRHPSVRPVPARARRRAVHARGAPVLARRDRPGAPASGTQPLCGRRSSATRARCRCFFAGRRTRAGSWVTGTALCVRPKRATMPRIRNGQAPSCSDGPGGGTGRLVLAHLGGYRLEMRRRKAAASRARRARRSARWSGSPRSGSSSSVGNAAEADRHLGPLVEQMEAAGIRAGAVRFVPDEIEALIVLDRLDEAETTLARFERRARRSERTSALAAGRCRGLLAAARGDLAAALSTLERALAQHDRVPMPFERARTPGAGRGPASCQAEARSTRDARGIPRLIPRSSAPRSGRGGAVGARTDRRAPARQRLADADGAAGGGARRRRAPDKGSCGGALRVGQDGRGAPVADLRQARRALPHRTRCAVSLRAASALLGCNGGQSPGISPFLLGRIGSTVARSPTCR